MHMNTNLISTMDTERLEPLLGLLLALQLHILDYLHGRLETQNRLMTICLLLMARCWQDSEVSRPTLQAQPELRIIN